MKRSYLFLQQQLNWYFASGKYFLLLFLIYCSIPSNGQNNNIGTPFTYNYPSEIYKAGTQNWDIQQHPNGFLFFANNDGLLQFDGTNWQIFQLPNRTIVRSLHIDKTGRIYVGGQGEFGYFEPTTTGQLHYQSLLELIPLTDKSFTDVWEIVAYKGAIYFNASDKIYQYIDEKITVYSKGKIKFIGKGNDRLFIGNELGLFEMIGGEIVSVQGGEQLVNHLITDIIKGRGDTLLIATLKNGLFKLDQDILQPLRHEGASFLKQYKIYCATTISADLIALGTPTNGVIIMNQAGTFLHHLNTKNGLQNNGVLGVFKDRAENLWVGLDNGIDNIAINTPFSKLLPDETQKGTAYTAKIINDKIYLGTSSGLYQQNWQPYYNPLRQNDFQLLEGSQGQVWNLNEIEQELFLGHHEGSFLIKDKELKRLPPTLGAWTFLSLKDHPNYLLVGHYEGIDCYKKEKGQWTFVQRYEGIKESCRIIEQDLSGNIWVAHPYRGIYKIQLTPDLSSITVRLYGQKDGLPNDNLNHVFKINKEVIFTGETGVYKYDPQQDRFYPYETFEALIGKDQSIQRLFEDSEGSIWFTTSTETGILKISNKGISKSFTKKTYPELDEKLVRGFEFIYPYNESNVLIGAEKGFIHFNPSKPYLSNNSEFAANIVDVRAIKEQDTVFLSGQYNSVETKMSTPFPNNMNALQFSYSVPIFADLTKRQYATKLEGFDKKWSDWTTKTEKEYTNLYAGDYRFLVKAKSNANQESKIASFAFSIKPPWYKSTLAIVIYSLLGLLFLSSLIFIPQKRFKREKAMLESEQAKKEEAHQKAVIEGEQAIIALKNEQLETEIAHKNRELAISTMHLVQRKELIHKLQEPLKQILRKTTDKTAIAEIKRITRLLNEDATLDEAWGQFAHHFDQVHINFLKRLREQHPQLTATDQKLCAYLRMNLSTKEIAPLMNISIRGVEAGRYRIRKKLGLDNTVNLNEFMINI